MGSDRALYVRVRDAAELRALLPGRFESVELAAGCAFGRVADSAWPADRLAELAARIAAGGREVLVMAYSSVTNEFWFARFVGPIATRVLDHADGWRAVRGTPEPWEAELAARPAAGADDLEFDAWSACDLAGEHYRLTGWHAAEPGPPPRQSVRELVLHDVATLVRERQRTEFFAHAAYFVPVDVAGAPALHDGALVVCTTADDLAASRQLGPAEVLALAAELGASVLQIDHDGARLAVATLDATG